MRKDSSRQALQTNEKIFQIFRILFELTTFFKIMVALSLCMRGGGGICADQLAF